MKLSHLFFLLALLAIFSWFMKHESTPEIPPSGIKIKVGVIAPFSGSHMGKGKSGLQGVKFGQAILPYLDNGDAIEFVLVNDLDNTDLSVQALRKLVQEQQVACILVFSDSDSLLAMAKVADRYKTPIVAVIASHPDITKDSAWINQFNFDDTFQASVAALYVRDELLIDKVAILAQADNAHFSHLAKEFSRQFKEVEGEVTELKFLSTIEQDYSKILNTIKSKEPELLYLPLDLEFLFNIKMALDKLDWSPELMVSDGMVASVKAQTKYPLNFLNGMMAVDTFSYDMNFTEYGDQLLEEIALMGFTQEETGTYTALGAEAYALVVHAINQCLELESKQVCINDAIRSSLRFEGIKGLISFDETGKAHRSLVINRVENGQLNFIVQVF